MALIIGESFDAVTVTVKFMLLRPKDGSVTVMKTVVTPVRFGAGVRVRVRLVPLPPRMMLFVGSNVGLEEFTRTVRLAAGVSASRTVKLIGPSVVSSGMDWAGMTEMVGLTFAGSLTFTRKVRETTLLELPPSLTVT